jgi:hypothetical protein
MTVTFQATKRFPQEGGRLADHLLANLERIASVEQPYSEIVHIEELRNDNQERVIQMWGFTFAFALLSLPFRPSHSHFLLKITELSPATAQVHILLMSVYAGPSDGFGVHVMELERERQQKIAAKLLEFCEFPKAAPWTNEPSPDLLARLFGGEAYTRGRHCTGRGSPSRPSRQGGTALHSAPASRHVPAGRGNRAYRWRAARCGGGQPLHVR